MVEIEKVAVGLKLKEPGFWVTSESTAVSFPSKGHEHCFSIEESSFWFQHRNRAILNVVRRYPPPLGGIMDVGGGNGYVAMALQSAGWDVVLLEPGIEGARNARTRGLRNVIQASFEDSGLRDQSLPAVGLFDVLEHIQEDLNFLKKVQQALISGGKLYLTVPAGKLLWSQEDDYSGHFRRYDAQSLGSVLRSAGFRIDYLTHIFAFIPLPVFLLRVIPYRLGLKRSMELKEEKNAHAQLSGRLGRLLDAVLKAELGLIRRGWSLPFGGSLLISAHKENR